MAKDQIKNGAQILDLNFDEGMLDAHAAIKKFCCLIAGEPGIATVHNHNIPIYPIMANLPPPPKPIQCNSGAHHVGFLEIRCH